MNPLINFIKDTHTRDAVFNFQKDFIDKYIIEQVHKGTDVTGLKHAIDILLRSQLKMIQDFTPKIVKKNEDRAF